MNIIKRTFIEAKKTPGFSLLYIVGVAFTITFTLIYGIILYGQLAPVYPEYDRGSTFYIDQIINKHDQYINMGGIGKPFIDQFLRDSLKSAEKVTAIAQYRIKAPYVQPNGRGPEFPVQLRLTDPTFFDFYNYEFLAGRPFSQEEFEANENVAVISHKVASILFDNPEDAVGESISLNHSKSRITGVFREGSALNVDSYGEVFMPYAYFGNTTTREWHEIYRGDLKVIIKVKPGEGDLLRQEIMDICRRINAVDTTVSKFIIPQVPSHAEHILAGKASISYNQDDYHVQPKSPLELAKPFLIGLLVILVIPALNISGLIGARMNRLRADIGIRRCFGATRRRLMGMVLTENLFLTLAGGILGLLTAWIVAAFAGDFLMQFTPMAYEWNFSFGENASFVTGEMAFAPLLFILTLFICVVLNLISAWIPARKAMRRQITDSLNSKR